MGLFHGCGLLQYSDEEILASFSIYLGQHCSNNLPESLWLPWVLKLADSLGFSDLQVK